MLHTWIWGTNVLGGMCPSCQKEYVDAVHLRSLSTTPLLKTHLLQLASCSLDSGFSSLSNFHLASPNKYSYTSFPMQQSPINV